MTTSPTKLDVLATATDALTTQVATLTGVVAANTAQVVNLRKEVNQKPDDSEVQFITGLAKAERSRHLYYAIGTAIVSAITAGGIAYWVADTNRQQNCEVANERIDAAVKYYNGEIVEEQSNKFIDDALRQRRVMRNETYRDMLDSQRPEC